MNRQQHIREVLNQALEPILLEITDESHKHRHSGNETHFKLLAVSKAFQGMALIQRHRLINKLRKEEFEKGLHALSLQLFTAEEWEEGSGTRMATPPCRGAKQ